MPRHALRKELRRALVPLVAALACVVFTASTLAQSGKGHDNGQRQYSGYEQSRSDSDDSNEQRGNSRRQGQKYDRGNSNQKQQPPDDDYDSGTNRGENSGRGNSNPQYRPTDQNYYNGRQNQQSSSLSAQGAAQRARSQFGGQVLKVQPSSNGYQVRLLKDDGRVVTVPIPD